MRDKSLVKRTEREVELEKAALAAFATRLGETNTQHERLAVTLHRLADMCLELESNRGVADPGPLVTEFELDLFKHFTAEEADDYFGAIARERPALLARVSELRAEHSAMLGTASELAVIAVDPRRRRDLVAPTRRLIAELRLHEDKENRLMQEFVQRDDGAGQD
jgi:hemerythrin